MDFLDKLFKIVAGFMPPMDAEPKSIYAWQQRMGVTLSLTLVFVSIITIAAFGFTPMFPGFAKADEVQGVVQEVRNYRVSALDTQILNLRIKHCESTSNEARQLYWSKIAPLLNEYQQLTHQTYTLPACGDL